MFFVRSLPAPLHSSFRVLPRVPRNGGPRTGAFFVSGTAFLLSLAPYARGATPSVLVSALSAKGSPAREGLVFGGAIIPPYSPFRGPAPLSGRVPRGQATPLPGPAACNKSSTAVDFWRPTPSLRSRSGWERALAHVRQARRARPIFPGFSGLKSKNGPPGAGSGCFPFFAGCFPTCYVNLANFTQIIGSASLHTPIFLCNPPPDAVSPPQRGREPR